MAQIPNALHWNILFRYIYQSRCRGPHRCIVEERGRASAPLLQSRSVSRRTDGTQTAAHHKGSVHGPEWKFGTRERWQMLSNTDLRERLRMNVRSGLCDRIMKRCSGVIQFHTTTTTIAVVRTGPHSVHRVPLVASSRSVLKRWYNLKVSHLGWQHRQVISWLCAHGPTSGREGKAVILGRPTFEKFPPGTRVWCWCCG